MDEKNVLICLDRLDIGGVETFVLNQSIALKNKGNNVIILSRDGIYRKELEKNEIKWIEFDFETKNYFDYEQIEKIVKIIKENKITEVHINQIPEMNYVCPACLITNVPYIAYLHFTNVTIKDDNNNVYDYFEHQYTTYKESLRMFLKYAYKIIGITGDVRDYTIKRYNLDEEKCIVVPNSINFEEYKSKRKVENIKNIILLSRLDIEKKESIINGIKLYSEIKKCISNVNLKVVGDGNIRDEAEKFVANEKIQDIEFVGATNDVKKYLEEADIVIGIDRCILEAIAMKRIAVISGYEHLRKIVEEKDIDTEIKENFCGRNLQSKAIKELAQEIASLDKRKISNLVEKNYEQISQKLDINKNIYTINESKYSYNINQEDFIKSFIKLNNILGKGEEKTSIKCEKIWNDHVNYKIWIEQEIKKLNKANEELKQEIERLNKINIKLEQSNTETEEKLNTKIKKFFNLKKKK